MHKVIKAPTICNQRYSSPLLSSPLLSSPLLSSLLLSSPFLSFPMQVFDIVLNGHVAVPSMDIFAKVGKAAAHDEIIPFSVHNRQLHVLGESSVFDGTLSVEFAKVWLCL